MKDYRLYSTIPPYTKYIGKPCYKFSRRHLGESKLLALEIADVPASLVFGVVSALLTQNVYGGIICAVSHQLSTPIYFYFKHKKNEKERTEPRTIDKVIGEELESK